MARKAKAVKSITMSTRGGAWWTSFRVNLGKAMSKAEDANATHVYIAQFTSASNLKPAPYQFGDKTVTL